MRPMNPIDQNADCLPRAIPAWPLHSVCDSCRRALSRTQVWCECGWEQRPPVVHILSGIDARLCASELGPPGEWSSDCWVPLERREADPLPNCKHCIDRLPELKASAETDGEPFSGAVLLRALELSRA